MPSSLIRDLLRSKDATGKAIREVILNHILRGVWLMRMRRDRHATRSPIVYECERCLHINASADTVWSWMADVRRLLSLNIFHVAVAYPEPVMQAGLRVPIPHHIWGLYRQ